MGRVLPAAPRPARLGRPAGGARPGGQVQPEQPREPRSSPPGTEKAHRRGHTDPAAAHGLSGPTDGFDWRPRVISGARGVIFSFLASGWRAQPPTLAQAGAECPDKAQCWGHVCQTEPGGVPDAPVHRATEAGPPRPLPGAGHGRVTSCLGHYWGGPGGPSRQGPSSWPLVPSPVSESEAEKAGGAGRQGRSCRLRSHGSVLREAGASGRPSSPGGDPG